MTFWTDARTEQLTKLWNDGIPASMIAQLLGGTTKNAVVSKANRIGLPARDDPSWRNARLVLSTGIAAGAKRDGKGQPIGRPRNPRTRQSAPPETKTRKRTSVQPPEPAKPSLNLSILDLGARQCRYSTGEGASGDFLFCGHETAPGSSYCPAHRQLTVNHIAMERHRKRKPLDDRDRQKLADLRRAAGQTRAMG
jgi:GcrA cell cycle regulator